MFFDAFSSKKGSWIIHINSCGQSCCILFPCCYFTGKEKDEETGYGYFGARYMDHELMTMWLSVDPMADKYPSISPYAYCAWNPVRLVDPDGKKVRAIDSYSRAQIKRYFREQFGSARAFKFKNGYLTFSTRGFRKLYQNASDDQRTLLDGISGAISATETALVSVQSNNSSFYFSETYVIGGDIYEAYITMDIGTNSGATATEPLSNTNCYPIAINDKGFDQGNSLTTDYSDEDGHPITTSSTAACVFMHELLDEFLNTIVNKEVTPESPNREKVCYENAAMRNVGLLERNGADHDY